MLTRVDMRGEDGVPETLLSRPVLTDAAVAETVREVIAEVRQRGDAALYDLTERFDGVRLESLVVPSDVGAKALLSLPSDLRDALVVAEAAVRRHHEKELRTSRETLDRGLRVRTLPRPMARAGCYVPGGRAAYPSTVLMTAVVARVAGVDQVVVCVPPGEGGRVAEATLAAIFPTARDHLTFPELLEEGFDTHKVSEAWIMGHPDPDHWVDVSDHMDTSLNALMEHASQLGGRPADELGEMMRTGRRNRALGKGIEYAESFRRIVYDRWRPAPSATKP